MREADDRIRKERDGVQVVVRDQRLCDVELKVGAGGTADGDGEIVTDNLRAHLHETFALRRVYLTRHNAAAGLVFRQLKFAESGARPGAEKTNIVGNFQQRNRDSLQQTGQRGLRVVCGERLKLIWRAHERQTG